MLFGGKEAEGEKMNFSEAVEILYTMKKCPGMFVTDYKNYDMMSSFINGYITALGLFYKEYTNGNTDSSIRQDLIKWYNIEKSNGKKSNVVLSHRLKYENENLSDEQLIDKYIDTVIEFLNSRIK